MQKKILLIGMPGWSRDWPPHSLAHVAGLINGAGWECRIQDLNIRLADLVDHDDEYFWWRSNERYWCQPQLLHPLVKKYDIVLKRMLNAAKESDQFDMVAFSVNGFNRYFTLFASAFMRSLDPKVPILFGGYECFSRRHNRAFFLEEGAPDIICQGEAEIALPEFLNDFKSKNDYRTSVKGFVYNDGGEIVDTGEPVLPLFHKSSFTADWAQFDFSLYKQPGDFGIFFSRGCTNRCTFCSDCNDQKNYRARKPEDVIREIKAILPIVTKYAEQPMIHFSDQLINGDIKALNTLCDLIIESNLSISWHAQLRFRPEMTRELLEKMYLAGCRHLSWGFEHASQKIIDLMRKDYEHEMAVKIFMDAHEVGIQNYLATIVGFPGETIEDLISTIQCVFEYGSYAYFEEPGVLAIPANSQLHTDYKKWGLAGNQMFDWVSADGRNTSDVRMFRQVVLRNAIENKPLAIHSFLGWDDIMEIDFSAPAVESDVAALLYSLWKACNTETIMASFFSVWESDLRKNEVLSEQEIEYWRPTNIPKTILLLDWFNSDKNREHDKRRIVTCILEALRDLRD